MTKKDYKAIAEAIKKAKETITDNPIEAVADNLIWILQLDNPRFDRSRFLRACGLAE